MKLHSAAVLVAIALFTATACDSAASTQSGPSSQDLSSFQEIVDSALAPVTEWSGPDETPTPPKDISVAVIVCSGAVSGCVRQGEGVAQAGEALGWNVTSFDGRGDPVAQNQAMTQAVNSGADAIILAAADPVPLRASIELASSRGIPVGTTGLGLAPSSGVAFDIGPDYEQWGEQLGSWIVTDSMGTANFLPTIDREFANSVTIAEAMVDTVGRCEQCEVQNTEQFVVTDIGNGLGQRIASTLQSNPNIDYVSGAFDSAAADMVPAIANAGLTERISLVSCVGAPQNIDFVKSGNIQKVDVVQDDIYLGFAAVDQMIRLLVDQPLWQTPGVSDERVSYGEGSPSRLLTADNADEVSEFWVAENGYVERFYALWGVTA
nr:substrate-binding domain-containing protein [Rhodococcus sp. 15-1154-1]